MYRIAICEDNTDDNQTIINLISLYFKGNNIDHYLLDSFSQEYEFQLLLSEDFKQYDIYIFDIELNASYNGLHYAQIIHDRYPFSTVLFISNHVRYARYGYVIGAVRYIYKPNIAEEINEALDFAITSFNRNNGSFLVINSGSRFYNLLQKDIVFIERTGRHIQIHTIKNDIYLSTEPLHSLISKLNNKYFVYINRYCIVNLNYVRSAIKDKLVLEGNNTTLYMSRRQAPIVRESISKMHFD